LRVPDLKIDYVLPIVQDLEGEYGSRLGVHPAQLTGVQRQPFQSIGGAAGGDSDVPGRPAFVGYAQGDCKLFPRAYRSLRGVNVGLNFGRPSGLTMMAESSNTVKLLTLLARFAHQARTFNEASSWVSPLPAHS